jgi:hypothetical protein
MRKLGKRGIAGLAFIAESGLALHARAADLPTKAAPASAPVDANALKQPV